MKVCQIGLPVFSLFSSSVIIAQTASNGLTKVANDFRLGGTLTLATAIDMGTTFTFKFSKGASNYFFVDNNGNIGLGTATPNSKLTIQNAARTLDIEPNYSFGGGVGLRTNNIPLYVDVGTQLTDALLFGNGNTSSGNNTIFSISRTAMQGGKVQLDAFNSGIGGTDLILNSRFGGNIGIRTTAPMYTLDILSNGTGNAFRVADGSFSYITTGIRSGVYATAPQVTLADRLTIESSSPYGGNSTLIRHQVNEVTFTESDHPDYPGSFAIRQKGGNYSAVFGQDINGNINFLTGGNSGKIGINIETPTARLHLPAGGANASLAPLKFTSGALLTNTEAGALEYDGSHIYFTATNGGIRYQLDQQDTGSTNYWTQAGSDIYNNTSGNVGIGTTNTQGYKLVVNGSGKYFTSGNNSPTNPNLDITDGIVDGIISTWGNKFAFGTYSNHALSFVKANSEIVSMGGNYTLDVNGTIRVGSIGSDPTASNGVLFYNSSINQFRGYRNGQWKNFLMEGDASGVSAPNNQILYGTGTGVTSVDRIAVNTLDYCYYLRTGAWGIFGQTYSDQGTFIGNNLVPISTSESYGLIDNTSNGSYIHLSPSGGIRFGVNKTVAGVTSGSTNMTLSNAGNLLIGTSTDIGYKLAVNGDAIFTKVKVKQYSAWPDYVFRNDHKLPSLNELEKYIQKNNHLPDVPSAREVEENGLDLGDNQAILLKKIEELTLYIIDINKKLEKLSEENSELKKKLALKSN
jgi:hypothetical protein